MNNKEFIAQLSSVTGTDAKVTQRLVNEAVEELSALFDKDGDVLVHGFGTFELKKRKERIIINPASMKRMLVPPKVSLTFKLSESMKSKIK